MALQTPRTDLHPPCYSVTFTSFGSAINLHTKSASTGVPQDAMPSSLFIVAEAADVLIFKDVLGVSNSITFASAFYGTLPFTASTIETSTTVTSVTASWHPEP